MRTKRLMFQIFAVLAVAAFIASCAPKPAAPVEPAGTDLESLAKAEGTLTTIALPHDWANYGEIIETYKTKYGMQVNELNPDAGSADELEAIRANKDSKGPQAPDVVDVGVAYGPTSKEEGLLM